MIFENPNEENKKPRIEYRDRIKTVTREGVPAWFDNLLLFTITFWYFFFTGLAILFRAPIPREWLKIATALSRGKVSKKIQEMAEEPKKTPPPVKFKVVDLETSQPIKRLWETEDEDPSRPTVPSLH